MWLRKGSVEYLDESIKILWHAGNTAIVFPLNELECSPRPRGMSVVVPSRNTIVPS
jgi:hypothetical protein